MTTKKPTPLLDALLDRVEAVCTNNSALARDLGVDRQYVRKWVSTREVEPSGELTLALLQWVEAEEAKLNKNPERASTRPGRKTQLRKSSNENHKSGPP